MRAVTSNSHINRITREGDHETPRQTADLNGYAPALARHFREPVTLDARKSFIRYRFPPRRAIRGPVDTRDARAYPRQSKSIGLFTPSAPRCITYMEDIAWVLRSDLRRNEIGFVKASALTPADRYVLGDDWD